MAAPESKPGVGLVSRLREDLSVRWHQGDHVQVESYLEQYPHLASNAEAVADLVFAEVLLRVEDGDSPTLEEYVARFTPYADAIRRRWAVHQLLIGPTVDPQRSAGEAAPPDVQPGVPQIPGYRLVEELGMGGMGVVYKAWQEGLKRPVAIKTISPRTRRSPAEVLRFYQEIEAAGQLNDPNVVGIYSFGEHAGQLYFVMEYLSRGSLKDLLAAGSPSFEQTAHLVGQIAQGMQAAHAKGIVHRDLKPGNVLIDDDGKARVADFGLARLSNRVDDLTETGAILGTPWYMAPEQAEGRAREATAAADVWAIGVILFECLTGCVPYKGRSQRETLELVIAAKPVSPRQVNPAVPVGLDRICRKCLQKRPADRYRSAGAVVEELNAYLDGQQIEAPQPAWPGWFRPWQAALVGLVALLGGAALAMGPERKSTDSLARLESDLDGGKPVDLLPRGEPRYAQRIVGMKTATLKKDETGQFAISSPDGLCLLELVPDPKCERYRFRVEIRHLRAFDRDNAKIGLYVGRKSFEGAKDTSHLYTSIAFNEFVDEVNLWKVFVENIPKGSPPRLLPGPRLNAVHISPSVIQRGEWQTGGLAKVGSLATECFAPALKENGPWRTLTVEVTSAGICVFWSPARNEAGTLRAGHFEFFHKELQHPSNARYQGVRAELLPRGGIGLFVSQSTASFRNVVIEALDR